MMQFNRIRRPEWTDLAVVLGPNIHWVETAYEDLQAFRPEVLLGYRVRLLSPGMSARGFMIAKLVLLEGLDMRRENVWRTVQEADYSLHPSIGKVEWYDVHRGYDPPIKRVA